MKRSGPDSLSSWVVAVACCFINTMMYGMTRLSGVLFVASVSRFHVGREQASFPYTFANFIRNTEGPLVGFLGHKLGVRLVTTVGCFLAAIGVGTCFLAENINTIIVTWGAVFGFGFGLGNILLPVKVNQYFDKYRATASGISFSGACLGSFILPPIVEILLDTYGLSGTFLILAGLVLNCVPAALLLRRPEFQIQTSKPQFKKDSCNGERQGITSGKNIKLYTVECGTFPKRSKAKQNIIADNTTLSIKTLSYEERIKRLSTQTLLSHYSIRMSSPDPLDFEHILENSKGRRQVDQAALDCEISSVASDQDSVFEAEANGGSLSINRTLSDGSVIPPAAANAGRLSKSYNELHVNKAFINDEDSIKNSVVEKNATSCNSNKQEKSTMDSFSVIFDPFFLLVAITNALYCFSFVCMAIVIVDFARDLNVGYSNEKYILMSLSIGDFVGRLGLGWVTDNGYLTRTNFAALCFLCQGVTTTAIAWSTGFNMLVTLAALYGLSEAGLIVIFPLIIAEFIEEEKQTVAIPCSQFLAGPLCLTIAPLIGFFRDKVGSYEYIFFGIGIISAACCVAWLLSPLMIKCRKRKH